jgi:hypothetical protein
VTEATTTLTRADAQVMYTFWELDLKANSASLVSALDHEAPAGLGESFTCTRGSKSIKILQFHDSPVEDPDIRKTIVRSASFVKGCSTHCRQALALFYTAGELKQMPQLVPKAAYVSSIEWKQAKEMLSRRLEDRGQFGDLTEAQQLWPRKLNARRLKHFQATCGLE